MSDDPDTQTVEPEKQVDSQRDLPDVDQVTDAESVQANPLDLADAVDAANAAELPPAEAGPIEMNENGELPEEPEAEEIVVPQIDVKELIRARVALSGLSEDMWQESHEAMLEEFIQDSHQLLCVYMDPLTGLQCSFELPSLSTIDEVAYFLRPAKLDSSHLTADSFFKSVQFGTVSSAHMESLLRVMQNVYAPLFFENKNWPDSVRNDFASQLHRFLASLTDTRWKLEGKTVLYVPIECQKMEIGTVAKDKELVQRLEAIVIHWTRQIKEVLTAQDTLEISESAGPLEEIEFWKNRCDDLSGISGQLDKPGVKKITDILETAKSSYVAPFLKLSSQIKESTKQAQSNLRFLAVLREPCYDLAESNAKDVPIKIPKIINLIRMVWVNSEYYKSRERLISIFRKLSNEVIRICCREISLDRIFDGYIHSSMQTLNDAIRCCESYKDIYERTAKLHHKFSEMGWSLDKSSIFAQIDAFIQRCKDLQEICECQKHFARWEEGEKKDMPQFGGARGPEIARSFQEIEVSFAKRLVQLRSVKRTILDVKNTVWHDEYNKFRSNVKDLEVAMQNVINTAFETVATVEQGVELLDVFMHLATRETIYRTLEKRSIDVFGHFKEEMDTVKRELQQRGSSIVLPALSYHPKYGGLAHWSRMLKKRLQRSMMILDRCHHFLPHTSIGDETRTQYQQLISAMDDFQKKTFYEWSQSLDREPLRLLDIPLMCRSTERSSMIDSNFNKSLIKMFVEYKFWERMVSENELPQIQDILQREADLIVLREHVMLVVRDYNRIVITLNPDERGLFRDRIRFLDKKIQPGLTKLTWASKGVSDYFIQDCRVHASKLQQKVDEYKSANALISRDCVRISEALFVLIDPKIIYQEMQFDEDQSGHRRRTKEQVTRIYDEIIEIMRKTYETFKSDPNEVQAYWAKYTEKMDAMCEEAFRLNAKASLQELSKSLNGDGKSGPNAVFRVRVILDRDHIDYQPTLQQLYSMVSAIHMHIVECAIGLPRLQELLTKRRVMKAPIHEVILHDNDCGKIQKQILAALDKSSLALQDYLTVWDPFREIWELDKDAFIRRYRQMNPPVANFEGDIQRYVEISNNVDSQETHTQKDFVQLDCSLLKSAILSHCQEWQSKFMNLLLELAIDELKDVYSYLQTNAQQVSKPPQTLDELGKSLALWDQLHNNLAVTQQRFTPLTEQFLILEKREVPVPDQIKYMYDHLEEEWVNFQQMLNESEQMLKKHKDKFRTSLMQQSDDFKKQCVSILSDFVSHGPFNSKLSPQEALSSIQQMKLQLAQLKQTESEIKQGLGIFKIEQASSKELAILEHDLEAIEQIWELALDWDNNWLQWKTGRFADLQTAEMETQSQNSFKRLQKLSRELRDKNWEVVETTKAKVDQFRRTMPLIQDLKNPAMRARHWNQIRNELNIAFDESSDDFTLEKIIEYQFDQHDVFIKDVSSAATKELAIEQGLQKINDLWNTTELDIVAYKDKGHFKVRSTDDVFQALEDNQVQLATMKASRFVKAFEHDVDRWERTLSRIMEAIEMLLLVQRQWLYLEQIFLGEDIRKQLPKESKDFDDINVAWKNIMTRINKDRNALRATHQDRLIETMQQMNGKLEEIQKSLDMYLETKRQAFPRFYFVSNDDLLEILGQGKNPEAIQVHLKKCFDNIKSLKLEKSSLGTRTEVLGMFSSEQEFVPFKPLPIEGPVESWLSDVERWMRSTLREQLKETRNALKKSLMKRDKWVREWPGQMCITSSQIQWTADAAKAIQQCKELNDKKPLKTLKRKEIVILNKFSEAIRGQLTKMQRAKVVALVTIEVHQRDIIDKLVKSNVTDPQSFEWISQLRFYWDKEIDDCIVRQTSSVFPYGYEYLGNSGRLVITALTDRCYITLTTALFLHRGGSPKGPAGTGKTETTKDLGKALGYFVIVINCSEGLDYKSMGRMFSGLAQTGAWGCFDEFNRINVEVLSVVAQQIMSILAALSANAKRFVFEGQEINLRESCGLFITMNPGYSGRTELPDNLKSMFRPIAMVVPDSTVIAEITLYGEGFGNTKILAKKVFTLYSLAQQQLSKQDHYDFGLRALVSVLRYAGRKKRQNPTMSDEEILLLSMRDMNVPKMTSIDAPLFNAIVQDLFPGVEAPSVDYAVMKTAIEKELQATGLQPTPYTVQKVIQLYETKNSRHSTMIVGRTQSGKTVTWRTLQATLTRLNREGPIAGGQGEQQSYQKVFDYALNPKSISLGELYGEFDLASNEWSDGVLSSIMRTVCIDDKPDEKWIVFDGPVDTLWIESMNSLMDDNKILTLINGERIGMPEQVSLLFEVEDLAVASPATVSRAGMVYNDYNDLGWKPYVESWLQRRLEKVENKNDRQTVQEEFRRLFDKYVDKLLLFVRKNCAELIPIAELNGIQSLCRLLDCLISPENGVDLQNDADNFARALELWFMFSLMWSVCAAVNEEGRMKIDTYIREMEGAFPNKDTIFEYFVEPKTKTWNNWEEKLRTTAWKYNQSTPFYKLIVPTVDTARYTFLSYTLLSANLPVMLVGPVGTGKTSVAQMAVAQFDPRLFSILTVNMSAQTTSNNVQQFIESRVEKRTKGVYVPVGGKKLLTFCDDFNMPAKDTFGSQPPLELIRQWIDYGFWYDRQNQTPKYVRDMYLLAAMGPPGGGRMQISRRLQSRFNLINMTFPQESQIKRIFGTLIGMKLQDFEEEMKLMGEMMTDATIQMYQGVTQRFLPTPTRIHYLFNLRDISRVFQGLLRCDKNYHDSKPLMTRLWIHECFRVFSDRLIDQTDMEAFVQLLAEKLGSQFDQTFHNICPNRVPPIFGDYISPDRIYEDIRDTDKLKNFMNTTLNEYNNSPGYVRMSLVLFRDAVEHISRVVRVIRQPRGNMLLVGIGGSGRQSLTRLSAFMCEYVTFQIEVSKHYRKQEFRDDIKKLYIQCGVEKKETVFLFTDQQIVDESFVEDINNILSSGEVPGLYKPEEFEEVKNRLIDDAKKEGLQDESNQSVFNFLVERVRANLHVVLCMSPVGEAFRNRLRMYPALVNCTTIDWFSEWPQDALLEVAEKYVAEIQFRNDEEEKLKPSIATVFSFMQKSVGEYSKRMLSEMRRSNYVTPTNYLELVSGYRNLLYRKRQELGDAANKLRNGLSKLDETREKVQVMSKELEVARLQIQKFQKECDEYLIVLVQQKREADEQQKSVAQTSEKIGVEEQRCKQMADLAQADLAEALPALEEAQHALEALNKKDLGEVKSYTKPPPLVERVLEAVMILRGAEPTWAEAKRQLGESNFIKQLVNFDKDNISDRTLAKIGKYCAQEDFMPETVGKVSLAAKSLCMWVRAMELYGRLYRVVEPKRQRLNQAMATLKEKQDMLAQAKAKLAEIEAKMEQLQLQYQEKLTQKEELNKKAKYLESMLERAEQLVSNLAGEKDRWEQTVTILDEQMSYLPGDCLIAAAFISYMGPFVTAYRNEIVLQRWIPELRKLGIPNNPEFDFCSFMVKATQVRDWNLQGLPADQFSTENGVIVTRGTKWPLMIDPQGQALKWVKSMESQRGLRILDLQQSNYMQQMEIAVQFGQPVLITNVGERLDPSLDPILNKSLIRIGGALIIKLGDKEIEYNFDFRLYITTKLNNPRFSPELFSKTTIVNFAIKEEGLENQLLALVVRKERPDLEEQKDGLVLNIAAGRKKLAELEDTILRLLNESKGSLLDDEELVSTLQTSKQTSQEVTEQLQVAEQTEKQIDVARNGYRSSALRASILFFVLNEMNKIDPMYQFSLDAYVDLFTFSIDKSQRSPKLENRIQNMNDFHTYAVYKYACRALFERHKLLFSLQMCAKILESAGKLNVEEYFFFLRGGLVLDREKQFENPVSTWLPEQAWDNITELDKLANFHGIVTSFEQYGRDWNIWYTSAEPEAQPLPGEWDNVCNELQKMLIVRSLRQDRVQFCSTSFIVNNLGSRFVEPPVLDMRQVFEDSTARTPLIFVLSPGVDPTSALQQLVETQNMSNRFHPLSLGQGQAPIATRLIKQGAREGNWVYLANCHLSLSWMPQLDKLVEELIQQDDRGELHKDFRLWLSSSPHPDFPIAILQASIKLTTEPPKGLKQNLKRLYHLISEPQFTACKTPDKYKKLLFSLCFFHSVLLERKKFLQLGWNIQYEFNDSDFEVSENLLSTYLDLYDETPWEALKYLIADINYGGHVTDDWDRRLLQTYIQDYYNVDVVTTQFFRLSPLPHYYVPKDGPLSSYKEYISLLPAVDHPEVFGQHANADISAQIQETRRMFETMLLIQTSTVTSESQQSGKQEGKDGEKQQSKSGGDSKESVVLELSGTIKKQIPEDINYDDTVQLLGAEISHPLNVVLLQEIQRYNNLLETIRQHLNDLEKGIQGLVVMSSELEAIFNSLYEGRVPKMWEKAYSSMKPLASWIRDLVQRVDMFNTWATTTHAPIIFWLSAFTFPTGFLTAVLQTAARANNIPVDTLSWEFQVQTLDDSNLTTSPKEGVYVKGFYLQGAGWDKKNAYLIEANPMQLVVPMPTIYFKPVENKKKIGKGLYVCPTYYYPNRAGATGRPSFVVAVELKAGEKPAEHWIKRGTGLLLSLDN